MPARKATPDEIKTIQRALTERGLYAGAIDGIAGAGTREAIRLWQEDAGHEATGVLTIAQLIELGAFPAPEKKTNPISDFFTNLVVQKGAEYLIATVKGLPAMNILSGYRTYILGALILLCSAAETFIPGLDIPGYNLELGEAIMLALAYFTGRSATAALANK